MAGTARTPTILFVSAGGTISMERDPRTGRSVPLRTAAELWARAALTERIEARCVELPESLRIIRRPADLLTVARFLRHEMQNDVDGVVLTHGTDTLEEVAYFLDEVFPPRLPLVITGAMRPGWAAGYDGPRNVENALRLALTAAAGYGVLVTLNDEVFEAWSVYKTDTSALDAFAARRGAPRGRMREDRVELNWPPTPRERFGRLPHTLPTSAPILTMGIGEDAALLDTVDVDALPGVVIAGMGAGSIPPVAYERVLTIAKKGVAVVLCSSAASGRTAEEFYYPGAYDELRAVGVVIEDRLNARKTRIRLLLSLGLGIPYTPFGGP